MKLTRNSLLLAIAIATLFLSGALLIALNVNAAVSQRNLTEPQSASTYVPAKFPQYSDKEIKSQIDVGPIDIHRKYRSMEGPYVIQKLRVSDLIASSKIEVPGERVIYLDGPDAVAASMQKSSSPSQTSAFPEIKGLVDTGDHEREFYWFRGIKLQVIDENGKALPTGEFICHLNIDVDQVTRFMAFPELERTGNSRIMTLTQGQTEFHFPEPYAVPVAGDEEWTFIFQAANRTTNDHRVIKHRCTLIFSKDSELKKPLKALHWFNPYVAVQVDPSAAKMEHHGPSCLAVSQGTNAENMVPNTEFKDPTGRTLTGHWSVPPGLHKYQTPVIQSIEPDLAKENRKIHAVWTHVHPACTNCTLSKCDGEKKRKIFSVNVSTDYKPGPELRQIDNILSKEGIDLPAGDNYELSAVYENPEKNTIDSMVALGVFCESKKFVRPDWIGDASKSQILSPSENGGSAKAAPGKIAAPGNKGQSVSKGNCDLYCGIKPPVKTRN